MNDKPLIEARAEDVAESLMWPEDVTRDLVAWLTGEQDRLSDALRAALDAAHAAVRVHSAVFSLCRYLPLFAEGEYKPPAELD